MKKILFIIAIFYSFCSSAQVKTLYNQYGGEWKRLYPKTGLRLPQSLVSTKDFNVAAIDSGQIYYNPADSSIHYHTGFQDIKITAFSLGSTNSNIGSGYRLAVPGTNNIKTVFPGYAALIDSTTNANALTIKVDSATLALAFLRIKDSSINGGYYPYSTNPKSYIATRDRFGFSGEDVRTTANRSISFTGSHSLFLDSLNGLDFYLKKTASYNVTNYENSNIRLGITPTVSFLGSPDQQTTIAVYNDTIFLNLSSAASKLIASNLPYNSGASVVGLGVDTLTDRVYRKTAGNTYTGSSGIKLTSNNFKLGGINSSDVPLTEDRYINTGVNTLFLAGTGGVNQSFSIGNDFADDDIYGGSRQIRARNSVTNEMAVIDIATAAASSFGAKPNIMMRAYDVGTGFQHRFQIVNDKIEFSAVDDAVSDIDIDFRVKKIPSGAGTKVVRYDLSNGKFYYADTTIVSSMVYPGAGIALSTGSAWATSITDNSANWNTAYTDRLKWDGGATGLTAATGRTSLGANTIGSNVFTSTNPSAIKFLRANADNTVDWLNASDFRTAIGVPASGWGVTGTSVADGNYFGSSNNRSVPIYVNGAEIGLLDSVGLFRWAAPTQNINTIHGANFFKAQFGEYAANTKSIFWGNTNKTLYVSGAVGGYAWSMGGSNSSTPEMTFSNNDGDARFKLFHNGEVVVGTTDNGAELFQVNGSSFISSYLRMAEQAAPSTPAANTVVIYPKADGLWYGKDDAGTEVKLSNNGGNITTNFTDAGNITTGVDDLMSYSIPAGQLAVNGDYLEFTMTFKLGANANSKQIRVVYGAATVYASGAQIQNDGVIEIKGTIIRTGAATQRISFSQSNNTTLFSDYADYVTATETLSGAVILKATGEGVNTDDIIQKILTVKYIAVN